MQEAVMKIGLPFPQLGKGGNKIREMYDLSYIDHKYTFSDSSPRFALIVNTDRISTEDVVMKNGIPGKGKVLNKISAEIFTRTQRICPNHFVSDKFEEFPKRVQIELAPYRKQLDGRSMLVYLAKPIKAEAIVRFYLTGSGYKSYTQTGKVCGIKLPLGLKDGDRLPAPIFTPSTKAPLGQHDQLLTLDDLAVELERSKHPDFYEDNNPDYRLASKIRAYSISLASEISIILSLKGITLRDTKFEFGIISGIGMIQIDETATPDSSRYDPDYSKEPFRKAMREIGFNGEAPMEIPDWLVEETSGNYRKMCQLITGADIA
ncbi:MAG: phosphoribosylaminoimidazolesuccinocarboxamide synthase [Candidatus Pacebacteria bacterium]|nr:phosphoribosylaminoimidazolesuccinocarboxamide synthase [Candidatus Paceibacterota bacterium]